MSFFSDKWKNSSILTKVALFPMLLSSILFLICTFVMLSWERMLVNMAGGGTSAPGLWVPFIILFLFTALLSFGLFKVNRIARGWTIFIGLFNLIIVVLFIAGIGYLMTAARAAVGDQAVDAAVAYYGASMNFMGRIFVDYILPLIPASILAQIGFYIFIFMAPPVLIVLSMLILLFCGKDYKGRKIEKLQPAE